MALNLRPATYGRLERQGNRWVLSGLPPHVALRLKSIFPRVPKEQTGVFDLPYTQEMSADLRWFMHRFPLEMSDGDRAAVEENTRLFEEDRAASEAILLPDWQPSVRHGFRPGLEAYHYQKQASELLLRKKSLLLGDDVGLGKTITALHALAGSPYLPAAIVVQAHLPSQWVEEFITPFTFMSAHIIDGTTPYSLPPANLYIFRYSNIHGWVDIAATGIFKAVVFDEIQELRKGTTTRKGKAAKVFSDNAAIRAGLSVAPETVVVLRGGPFGLGWIGGIEQCWEKVDRLIESEQSHGYDIIPLHDLGVETRGWIPGVGWAWKPVLNLIRHSPRGKTMHVLRAGGRALRVTDDHSVFIAKDDGLTEKRSDVVAVGDVVLIDDGARWDESTEELVETEALVAGVPGCQVVVDLSDTTRKTIGATPQEWQNFRKRSRHGDRLPLDLFQEFRSILPPPTAFYAGRGHAPKLPAAIRLSDWAYILGFYLGDGWVSGRQRVCFAVESDLVGHIVGELASMGIGLRPKVRQMMGASCEVRCSHRLFAEMLTRIFDDSRCFEKRIPSEWVTSWPVEARRRLLCGMIDSDGHLPTKGRDKSVAYCTTSLGLAKDLLTLLSSLGIKGGVHERKAARGGVDHSGRQILGGRPSYQVFWSPYDMNGDHHSYRCGAIKPIKWAADLSHQARIRSNHLDESVSLDFVYDFEVEGHPSFSADGILAHNSATPVYNYGGEVFEILSYLNPEILGAREDFYREWCRYGGNDKWIVKEPDALGSYMRESQIFVRRLRQGRPINRIPIEVDYDEAVAADAAELARKLAMKVMTGSFVEKGLAARELDAFARLQTGLAKAEGVAALVRMHLEKGIPILLAGWHREVYSRWLELLADFKPLLYTGSETSKQKDKTKKAFINGDTDLMIISLRSGAGLDGLQKRCSTVVVGEFDWSPAVIEQLLGRVDRPGQKADEITAIFPFVNFGSDPTIMAVNAVKKDQQRGIHDPGTRLPAVYTDESRIKMLAESFLSGANQ